MKLLVKFPAHLVYEERRVVLAKRPFNNLPYPLKRVGFVLAKRDALPLEVVD